MVGIPPSITRPLHAACRKKSYADTLKSYETKDVNVRDQNGLTPLMLVISPPLTKKNIKDTLKIISFLISKGADVNCRDCDNNTVLHRIANLLRRVTDDKKLIMPILKLLIKHGADPSIKNRSGETCCKIAYKFGAWKVGDFLNFSFRDYVDGEAQNQQSEVFHQPIYENIQDISTFNSCNQNMSYPAYHNHAYDYYANASAPAM